MIWEARLARLFGLDELGWARHANPLSGWSRALTGLPVIVLAAWSRVWIGCWAVLPGVAALVWLLINPRLFPPPANDHAWMTRGVLGERLWARRAALDAPELRTSLPHALNVLTALGFGVMAWGLVVLDLRLALAGAAVSFAAKMGFIGCVAGIYRRASQRDPSLRYRPPA